LQQADNDPAARRAREKAAQLKSDMDNAASLFGASNISGKHHRPLSVAASRPVAR